MKPRELFGVVIRSVGLLMLIGGLLYLYSALVTLLAPDTPRASSPMIYLGACLVWLALGAYLLRGAPHLLRFAYRDDQTQNAQPCAAANPAETSREPSR